MTFVVLGRGPDPIPGERDVSTSQTQPRIDSAPRGGRAFTRVIRRFVRLGALEDVRRLLDRMHPAEVVQILRTLAPAERKAFTDVLLAHERAGEVLADLPEPQVEEILVHVNDERIASLLAVPVVDTGNVLCGIVTVDDAIDAITDETTREMYRLAGLNTEDRIGTPPSESVRRRLPWMVINLGTAVLASWVVSFFEASIAQVVALATFMPIVAGMGGNGATQALTVIIRGIALGEIDFSSARRAILKEITVGVAIGVATGGLMAGIAMLWKGNAMLGLVICMAMIINLFVAGLTGAAVPLVLKWLKLDPALGSGVIVTTFTDCCGFLSFLGLGTLLLSFLK